VFVVRCRTCGRVIGPFATEVSARAHATASGHDAEVAELPDDTDPAELTAPEQHVLP